MDRDHHTRSLSALAANQYWLEEHREQVFTKGDLPICEQPTEIPPEPEIRDQQQ